MAFWKTSHIGALDMCISNCRRSGRSSLYSATKLSFWFSLKTWKSTGNRHATAKQTYGCFICLSAPALGPPSEITGCKFNWCHHKKWLMFNKQLSEPSCTWLQLAHISFLCSPRPVALLFLGSHKQARPSVPFLQSSSVLGLPAEHCDTYCCYYWLWLPSRSPLSAETLWGSTSDSHKKTALAAAGQLAATMWLQLSQSSAGFCRSAQAGGSTAVTALQRALYWVSCTLFSSSLILATLEHILTARVASFTSNLTWGKWTGVPS